MPLSGVDVEPALLRWHQTVGGRARLINHSENHTFLVERTGLSPLVMRVHREGYQSLANIESELAWLDALHRDTDLPTPRPIAGADGRLLQSFRTTSGELRHAVLFDHIAGDEPTLKDDLVGLFSTLGSYAARLHHHAINWTRPAQFTRQTWQAATILDADGLWGDWRIAPGVDDAIRTVLDRLDQALWLRLAEYGTTPDRFGLIHADMRLGNLLVDKGQVTLIDFDDCGFCWLGYDFAAAISFHETSLVVPALKAAWLDSYQRVRRLSPDDVAAIDSMVMLRRMALLAWIGSHAETALAQQHMPGFAAGTAKLAERYLRGALFD